MVKTMTAFFGIVENNSEKFFKQGVVCMDNSVEKEAVLFKTFQSVRTEDIVFIKSFTQAGLKVKAVGVVLSSFPTENELRVCIPVEWIWIWKVRSLWSNLAKNWLTVTIHFMKNIIFWYKGK